MINRITLLVALVLPAAALAQRQAPWGTGESRGEDLKISLVTFGDGDTIPEWFGHTGLLVQDTRLGQELIYNFGYFDFGPDMLPKFLMGRLEFWVGDELPARSFSFYQKRLNRSVRLQELNLSPSRRLEMARKLAIAVRPENRTYLYHHYDDNCATRIRDLIDEATGGQFEEQNSGPATMPLRDHTRRHFERSFYVNQVLIYWMNDEIDREIRVWDEMFLPSVMEARVDAATYVDESGQTVPLVKSRKTLFEAKRPAVPEEASTTWPFALLWGLLFGGGALLLVRWHQKSGKKLPRTLLALEHLLIGLLAGFPALVLCFFWFTEHTVTHFNETNLLANPLTALAFPLGIGLFWGSRRAIRWLSFSWTALAITSALLVVLKLLPAFDQHVIDPVAFFLPLNVGMAQALWRLHRGAAA
ncbi:MAG: DUF4105 domain-containing protein [Deltaproteobacteria bacterium]|nr:DUF4105 domain-containing protein [Deltaproteobacteria bacterium]